MDPVESLQNKLRDQLSTPLRSIIQIYLANSISNTSNFVAFGSKFVVDFLKYLEHVKSEGNTTLTEEQRIKFQPLQPLLLNIFKEGYGAEDILEEAISIISSVFRSITTDKKAYRAACDALVNAVVGQIEKEREKVKILVEAEQFGIKPLTEEEHMGLARLVKILRQIDDKEQKMSDGHIKSLVSMPALRLMNTNPEIAEIFPFIVFEEVMANVYEAFSIGETARYFLNVTSLETFFAQAEVLDNDLERFMTGLLTDEHLDAFPSMRNALKNYEEALTALKEHPKAWKAFVDFIKYICLQSFADRSYTLVNGKTLHIGDWYRHYLMHKARPKVVVSNEPPMKTQYSHPDARNIQTELVLFAEEHPEIAIIFNYPESNDLANFLAQAYGAVNHTGAEYFNFIPVRTYEDFTERARRFSDGLNQALEYFFGLQKYEPPAASRQFGSVKLDLLRHESQIKQLSVEAKRILKAIITKVSLKRLAEISENIINNDKDNKVKVGGWYERYVGLEIKES